MSTTPDPSMPVKAYLYPRVYGSRVGFVRPDDYVDEDGNLVQADNLIRQCDAEVALAALQARLEGAEKLLERVRPGVESASFCYYDGTDGHARRAEASRLLKVIDAHLAASKGAAA